MWFVIGTRNSNNIWEKRRGCWVAFLWLDEHDQNAHNKDFPSSIYKMNAEQLVPLNDGSESKPLKKQSSFGSDQGLNTDSRGKEDTLEYRIDTKNPEGKTISLWHDINVNHIDQDGNETEYLNFICEIPKFTRYDQRPSVIVSTALVLVFRIYLSIAPLTPTSILVPLQEKVRNCYR